MSFRSRLLLASLATLALGLGVLLVAGNVLLDVRVEAETAGLLRARTDAVVAAVKVGQGRVRVRETPNDRTLDRAAWVLAGARVVERPAGVAPALDRAAVALGRAGRSAQRDAPGDVRLRATALLDPVSRRRVGAVVVGVSTAALERLRQEVLVGSVVVAALVLAAGGLVILRTVRDALRPVARMTASAEEWGAHDLDRRFDLGPPRDELTGLAATLDHLLARIAASRRHEQRFASDVAHELRTPIAGLRGRAELALETEGPGAEGEREAALRAIVAQSARLDRTVDALLAIARQELDPSVGAVDLATLAAELDDVEVIVPASLPWAEGEPEVVRRALMPLVDNARRHAHSQVALELSSADGRVRVTVRDDGPGLDPEIGERAFEAGVRGRAGSGGAGLGLPLARRLARSCGGDITVRGGPGGCFVLELPAVAVR